MFTRDQIEEIKKKLVAFGTKDTQLLDAHKLDGNEIVAIVQDGENRKIPLSSIIGLLSDISVTPNDDFINVSKDTTGFLTLSTAVSKVDINNRKLGQVITFKDSANSWAIRQFTGSSLDNWHDISLWKSISGIDELKSQVESNAEDISVLSGEIDRHDASILNLSTDVSKLKDKDIETSSSLSGLTTRVDTLKSQADTNTSNISSINTEVSAMQSKVDVNTTSISQINNTIADHEESIAQINTTLEEHTEGISENKVAIEKNTSDIKNVSDTVDAQAARLDDVDTTLENAIFKNKGYFTTLEKLNEAIPNPTIGSKAYVGTSEPYAIYIVENGVWVDSGYTGGDEIVANITTDRIEDGAVTSDKIATTAFDSTLSVSGKIAPADVVGEKITYLREEIYETFAIHGDELLHKEELAVFTRIDGKYISAKTTVGDNTAFLVANANGSYTSPIFLHKNDTIKMYSQGTGMSAIALTDANGTQYTALVKSNNSSGFALREYTATEDCYVALSSRIIAFTDAPDVPKIISVIPNIIKTDDKIKEIDANIKSIEERTIVPSNEKELAVFTRIDGKYISAKTTVGDNTAFLVANANGSYTSPIFLHKNDTIKMYSQGTGMSAIALTNAEGSSYTALVKSTNSSDFVLHEYTATEDCYVALSSRTIAFTDAPYAPFIIKIEEKAVNEFCIGLNEDVNELKQQISKTELWYSNEIAALASFGKRYSNPSYPIISFLHISDTHNNADSQAYASLRPTEFMLDILNNKAPDNVKFCIHTGDMTAANFSNNVEPLIDVLKKSKKNVYLTIGNHDVGESKLISQTATPSQLEGRFITPFLDKWNLKTDNQGEPHPTGNAYYFTDITDIKLRLVVVNQYDGVYPTASEDEYIKSMGNVHYSQQQIDWFCNALSTTPSGYAIIVAVHSPMDVFSTDEQNSFFSHRLYGDRSGETDIVLCDIIKAYIHKDIVNKSYTQSEYVTLNVSVDFAQRDSTCEFVCVVSGHRHTDAIGFKKNYPEILDLNIGCNNTSYTTGTDMAQIENTKFENLINAVSVDRSEGVVHILRIGANYSSYGQKRDFLSLKYK